MQTSTFRPGAIAAVAGTLLLAELLLVWALRPAAFTPPLADAWSALQALLQTEVGGVALGWVLLAGFVAQLVDGALGMAFGLLSTALLSANGLPPAVASASVHVAEIGTTGVSTLAHWRAGNIHFRLWRRLVLPGTLGGLLGALLLTQLSAAWLLPLVNGYLLVCAALLLWRAWRWAPHGSGSGTELHNRGTQPLAVGAGLLDAVGGGGWGPLMTGSLLSGNAGAQSPRHVIGSVNAAEFVLALVTGVTLALAVGLTLWPVIAALVAGGLLAAPLGPWLCKRAPPRLLLLVVGVVLAAVAVTALLR
jgi:uncharacterized protein